MRNLNNDIIGHTKRVIYMKFNDGSKAFIRYVVEDHVMKILETYTPPQHRGKGVARKLMEYAIKLARENNWLIEPICSYAIYFFTKNPGLKNLLIPELRNTDLNELFRKKIEEEKAKKEQ